MTTETAIDTGLGHNSIAKLRSIMERATRILSERADLNSDFKDLMVEAKSSGYDPSVIRQVLKDSMEDDAKKARRVEKAELAGAYAAALGA